ncbi:hypothetical protein Hanom_Chr04g00289721 [Helianthus anomalus]
MTMIVRWLYYVVVLVSFTVGGGSGWSGRMVAVGSDMAVVAAGERWWSAWCLQVVVGVGCPMS